MAELQTCDHSDLQQVLSLAPDEACVGLRIEPVIRDDQEDGHRLGGELRQAIFPSTFFAPSVAPASMSDTQSHAVTQKSFLIEGLSLSLFLSLWPSKEAFYDKNRSLLLCFRTLL